MWRVMARFIKHARGNFRKRPYTLCWRLGRFFCGGKFEGYILKIHERKNSLVRPPIVNIDQAVVIMSVKEPDFNSNLLDRFLVLLEHKGIHPIVYISKMDLLEDGENWIFTSRPIVLLVTIL